jgi:hypothetical protein
MKETYLKKLSKMENEAKRKGKRYPNHSLEEKIHLLIIAHKYQHVISNQIRLDLMKKISVGKKLLPKKVTFIEIVN